MKSRLKSLIKNDDIKLVDENRVNYITSLKGTYQLCLDGFPYTRHRVRSGTIYWRCVQFRPLKSQRHPLSILRSRI